MIAAGQALTAGFAAPVMDAQASFRAVLTAMSRPGRVLTIDAVSEAPAPLGPAAAAVLLTLADAETPVWSDAGPAASAWLRFHAGCRVEATLGRAPFVLVTGPMPPLVALAQGSEEAPQEGATLILQVARLEAGAGWRLSGPGIAREERLHVQGAPADFVAQWAAQRARFPRGVDVIFCAGRQLAALPRSTRVEQG